MASPLLASNMMPSGYGPSDLQSAYSLPSATAGAGQTVAIVGALDLPSAESDLATYRTKFALPACTTANGCFRKVDQRGGQLYPAADPGWGQELALDLDMVSATCPNCSLLLVEADSTDLRDLGTGVNTAVSLGAQFVSNSYGGPSSSFDSSYDTAFFSHPGTVITAAAGDSGYGIAYPAASPDVTAVGGTSLTRSSTSRGWSESAWRGTGSGCAASDQKQSWQTDTGCGGRTVADVSAVADPDTGVAVYDSTPANGSAGWLVMGGTSASAPIIAASYALAGTPASGSNPASYPYAHPGGINDVTGGSNGSCDVSYLCTAGTGYDGPTGLGTPDGVQAFSAGPSTQVSRLAGPDRYATSAAVAATAPAGPAVAYVASGIQYADALSGAAAAGKNRSPVLLVAPDDIPAVIQEQLARLRPQRIVVLGGTAAVSDQVQAQLAAYTGGSVTRLAGPDRYATSAQVSAANFPAQTPVAYIASGTGFPDALSGAAAAAGLANGPVLLVPGTAVPAAISAELERLQPARIVVLGGSAAVSDEVQQQLAAYTPRAVTRLAGSDRYATSAAVSATFPAEVPVAYIASGQSFPDALSGAPAAGINGAPILLVPGDQATS
ncbi:MAG TPA: cell wall-binding repeat-containing protein, partial [Micrococcaceae bacterium]